jgi:hypothetical protein
MNKLTDGMLIPFFNNPAVTAPQKANIDPTERSIPAVKITNVMPTEMHTFTDIWRMTFQKLSVVIKLSVIKAKARHRMNSAMRD